MAAVVSNSALAVLPSTDAKPAVRFIWAQGLDNDIIQMTNDGQWKAAVSITKPLNLKAEEVPKSNSPIAAACSKDMKKIRVYYITINNTVSELCWDAAGDAKGFDVVDDSRRKSWTRRSPSIVNSFQKSFPFAVSPASDLAAFTIDSPGALSTQIQLHAQISSLDVMECRANVGDLIWRGASAGQDKLGNGIEGTRISVVGWPDGTTGSEGYFQTRDGQIVNSIYNNDSDDLWVGWVTGKLNIKISSNTSVKGQPAAVFGLNSIRFLLKDGKLLHRVYVVTPTGPTAYMVVEYDRDSKSDTWTKLPSVIGPVLAGTRLAAHGWNTPAGPELHLYLQNGVDGTKVVDWTKSGFGAWTPGPTFGVKGI